ncbi:carboxymuconolactone decarboxylase family protein [Phenylobacterium sp. VNQ135]|uniref:carboxymuconolactone decarboxylase family protein n=1 Tax=Phenylobacterium sp. VNQ135 TaxID=3400922 RepID=UPI003C0070C6
MRRYIERTRADLDPQQRRVYDAIVSGPRGAVLAPHHILLEAPHLAGPAQEVGAALRFGASLPATLTELAILVTARHWDQGFEWRVHAPLARAAGVSEESLNALAADEEATFASVDEALVYALCREVLRTGTLSDATFGAAVTRFGRPGLVELLSIAGFYSWLALLLNAHGVGGDDPAPSAGLERES